MYKRPEGEEEDEEEDDDAEDDAEDDDDEVAMGSNAGISRSDVQERLRRVKDHLHQLKEKADRADESDD